MFAQSSIRWVIGTAGAAEGAVNPLRTDGNGALLVSPRRDARPVWLEPVVAPRAFPGRCRLAAIHVAAAPPLPFFVQVFDAAAVPGSGIVARGSIVAARSGVIALAGGIPLTDGVAVAFSSHPTRLVPIEPPSPVVVNLAILPA